MKVKRCRLYNQLKKNFGKKNILIKQKKKAKKKHKNKKKMKKKKNA